MIDRTADPDARSAYTVRHFFVAFEAHHARPYQSMTWSRFALTWAAIGAQMIIQPQEHR